MAKKKTVRMKPTKVWVKVVVATGEVIAVSAYPMLHGTMTRVVGPITLREPRPRSSKR